jgi:hypothetical protein
VTGKNANRSESPKATSLCRLGSDVLRHEGCEGGAVSTENEWLRGWV